MGEVGSAGKEYFQVGSESLWTDAVEIRDDGWVGVAIEEREIAYPGTNRENAIDIRPRDIFVYRQMLHTIVKK